MTSQKAHKIAYASWAQYIHAVSQEPDTAVHELLGRAYPQHHITRTDATHCDLLGFAAAGNAIAEPVVDGDRDATRVYRPRSSKLDEGPGELEDDVKFGKWDYQFQGYAFTVYEVSYVNRLNQDVKLLYILARNDSYQIRDGHHEETDCLLLECGKWTNQLHEQIWIFDNAQWTKGDELWKSIQATDWNKIIMDPAFESQLERDIHGFFSNREMYKKAHIPWKRGVIFHGSPGNGKTTTINALVKSLVEQDPPVSILCVKTLDAPAGSKWSIQQVFKKARQASPCLLVLENLDSLIGEDVRSYFLHEFDDQHLNDGILVIGTTNKLARLDPTLTKRPGRFDRKYLFAPPSEGTRQAYCERWQATLAASSTVHFPYGLCPIVAQLTRGFSFAYLKELLVSSTLLRSQEDEIDGGSKPGEAQRRLRQIAIPDPLQNDRLLTIIVDQAQLLLEDMQ